MRQLPDREGYVPLVRKRWFVQAVVAASVVGALGAASGSSREPTLRPPTVADVASSQEAPGAFSLTGDPESHAGATWTFRGYRRRRSL